MSIFTKNGNEFETAYYFPTKGNRVTMHAIGVEVVSDKQRQFNTILQAISVDDQSVILKTTYAYDYAQGNEVLWRGKYWLIRSAKTDIRAIAPQSQAWSKPEENAVRYLDLIEVQ